MQWRLVKVLHSPNTKPTKITRTLKVKPRTKIAEFCSWCFWISMKSWRELKVFLIALLFYMILYGSKWIKTLKFVLYLKRFKCPFLKWFNNHSKPYTSWFAPFQIRGITSCGICLFIYMNLIYSLSNMFLKCFLYLNTGYQSLKSNEQLLSFRRVYEEFWISKQNHSSTPLTDRLD